MSGLYALFLLLLWCSFLGWLCWRFAKPRFRPPMNGLAAYGLFLLFLPLPLVDEIVGAVQMHWLCEANAKFRLGVKDPERRVTYDASVWEKSRVPGTAIPIFRTQRSYIDTTSGEVVLKFETYDARGGLLVNALFWAEMARNPLVGRDYCTPGGTDDPAERFGFVVDHDYARRRNQGSER